jgi:hypothetical protein
VLVHYVTCLCEESLFVYIKVNKIDVKIIDALVLLLQQRVFFCNNNTNIEHIILLFKQEYILFVRKSRDWTTRVCINHCLSSCVLLAFHLILGSSRVNHSFKSAGVLLY